MIQKFKSSIESTGNESKNAQKARKENILKNLQLVQQRVSDLNSQDMGYSFDLELPKIDVDVKKPNI